MGYKYSIIVPIYKAEKYLDECIESLISQTYEDIEIILVNDGSPDRSCLICDYFKEIDSRIKVVNQRNMGVVCARKNGLSIATGDYVCCVDADDYIDNNYIECIDYYAEALSPDVICTNYYETINGSDSPQKLRTRAGYFSKKEIESEIFPILLLSNRAVYFVPTVWGKAIKKELFEKHLNRVDSTIRMGEDGACIVPCIYESEAVYIIDKPLYHYRQNNDSATRGKTVLEFDNQIKIYETISKSIDLNSFDLSEQMDRQLTKGFFNVAKSRFYTGKKYRTIKKEIIQQMDREPYKSAIKNARFIGSKQGTIMSLVLRLKLILPIYFYSRLK